MPTHNCAYFKCNNTSDRKSVFRFPWNDANRLKVWLNNCGNMTIARLPPERLRSRYLCIDHFASQDVLQVPGHRSRLQRAAIPEPYKIEAEGHPFTTSTDQQPIPGKLNLLKPTKVYNKQNADSVQDTDETSRPEATLYTTSKQRKISVRDDNSECKSKEKQIVNEILQLSTNHCIWCDISITKRSGRQSRAIPEGRPERVYIAKVTHHQQIPADARVCNRCWQYAYRAVSAFKPEQHADILESRRPIVLPEPRKSPALPEPQRTLFLDLPEADQVHEIEDDQLEPEVCERSLTNSKSQYLLAEGDFDSPLRFDPEDYLANNSPEKPCIIHKETEKVDEEDQPQTTDVEACRICLVTDVKMYLLENLTQGMDSFAYLLNTPSYMPKYICYECAPTLIKFNKLVQKSKIALETLENIYVLNGMVTKSLIQEKDRSELKLESSLKTVSIDLYVGDNSMDTHTQPHADNIDIINEKEIIVKTVPQNEVDPLELSNIVKIEIDNECSDTETQESVLKDYDEVEPDVEDAQLIEKTVKSNEYVHNKITHNDSANCIQIGVPVGKVASDDATNRSCNNQRMELEKRAEALQRTLNLKQQRARIIVLSKQGYSIREISRELNISRNTVRTWMRRYEKEGILEDKRRYNHGVRHITNEQKTDMRHHYEEHPSTPTRYFAARYDVCQQTIRNHLHSTGLQLYTSR